MKSLSLVGSQFHVQSVAMEDGKVIYRVSFIFNLHANKLDNDHQCNAHLCFIHIVVFLLTSFLICIFLLLMLHFVIHLLAASMCVLNSCLMST